MSPISVIASQVLDDSGVMGALGNPRCKRFALLIDDGVVTAVRRAYKPRHACRLPFAHFHGVRRQGWRAVLYCSNNYMRIRQYSTTCIYYFLALHSDTIEPPV